MKYIREEILICLNPTLHEIRRKLIDFINISKSPYIGPIMIRITLAIPRHYQKQV